MDEVGCWECGQVLLTELYRTTISGLVLNGSFAVCGRPPESQVPAVRPAAPVALPGTVHITGLAVRMKLTFDIKSCKGIASTEVCEKLTHTIPRTQRWALAVHGIWPPSNLRES